MFDMVRIFPIVGLKIAFVFHFFFIGERTLPFLVEALCFCKTLKQHCQEGKGAAEGVRDLFN